MKKYPTQNAQIISKKDTKYCEKNLGAKIPPKNAQKTQKGIQKLIWTLPEIPDVYPNWYPSPPNFYLSMPEPARTRLFNTRARSIPDFLLPVASLVVTMSAEYDAKHEDLQMEIRQQVDATIYG